MSPEEAEDRFIRNLVVLACSGLALAALTAATVVTVLVSANFNVLGWME